MDYEVLTDYMAYAGSLGLDDEEVSVVALKLTGLETLDGEPSAHTYVIAAEDAVKVGLSLLQCADEILAYFEDKEVENNETEDA